MPIWLKESLNEVVLSIHVQPGAKRTEVVGTHGDALKLRLAAPPVDGKANDELIRFLADAFGVPQRQVELVAGSTGRSKRLRIRSATRRPDREWARP